MNKPGRVRFHTVVGAAAVLVGSAGCIGDRAHTYVFVNVSPVKLHIHWGPASDPASADNFDLPPGEAASAMYFGVTPPVEISTTGGPTVSVNIEPYCRSHTFGDDFYHVFPIDQSGKVYDLSDTDKLAAGKRGS